MKKADKYRTGDAIGQNNKYSNVKSGEIVGFPGHLAIYVDSNGCNCTFIDVPGPKKNVRCVKKGYGSQTVHKKYY